MQGNRTGMALAVLATLGVASFAAGCGSQSEGAPQATTTDAGGAPTVTAPTKTTPAAPTTTSTTTATTATTAEPATTPTAAPSTTPTTTTAEPTTTPTAAPTTTPAATPATPTAPATPATPPAAPTATPTAAAASGPVTGTIIPLYTSPSDPSWSAVAAAKAAHPAVPVLAVINPSNGPGGAATPAYSAGIAKLASAGVKVIGYVHTSWGGRPAAELQSEMSQWKSWYPSVSGIFFDEMANQAGKESYYAGLTSYAKSNGFDFTIGNPGSDSSATYVGTEDVILIYENGGVPSLAALGGWHSSYPRTNFGVIPYDVASLDTSFVEAAKTYVAYIYLQSDNLPNPWDSVPPYLADLVAALG
jgi:hypothetical protein